MADKDEVKEQKTEENEEKKEKKGKKEKEGKKEKKESKETEGGEKKSFVARFLPQMIIAVVVVFFASAGFTLGRMLAGSSTPQTAAFENGQSPGSTEGSEDDLQSWYYHLEPVIANLNVSDVTRYVKASLTLEVSSEVDEKEGAAFLDEKQPVLTNWLTVYLASLGLDDIRGDGNLKHIQAQIQDAFNEKLFPDSKPQIKRILFKEFAVQ
ncbi:MAG: flagellar basal body-associated FliL family protein [Planctomycetota bacterium]|jgi:flagellar basal body-associated protein FliL